MSLEGQALQRENGSALQGGMSVSQLLSFGNYWATFPPAQGPPGINLNVVGHGRATDGRPTKRHFDPPRLQGF